MLSFPRTIADMAIDVGTANSEIYVQGRGLMTVRLLDPETNEELETPQIKSAVARDISRKNKVAAHGEEAYQMLGREPNGLEVVKPLRLGRIKDDQAFANIALHLIRLAYPKYSAQKMMNFRRPTIVIGVPCNCTELELRAVREVLSDKARATPILVSEPVAAAIGAGLPFQSPKACTIIDIGGGTTDIAVMSLSRLVRNGSASIEIGGDVMDESIIKFIRKKYCLIIGQRAAEWIKQKIGTAVPYEEGRVLTCKIKGRPIEKDVKREIEITSDEIREECLLPILLSISHGIHKELERIESGDVHSDLKENGVWLTGGGSLLYGMDKFLEKQIGFSVKPVEEALLSVILGASHILNDPKMLKKYDLSRTNNYDFLAEN